MNVKEPLLINLIQKSYGLPSLTIKLKDPKEILKKVLEELPNNLAAEHHSYDAFHKEDGKAARLVECALNVFHLGNPEQET